MCTECCSVAKLFPTLYDPIDCSHVSFSVVHHLLCLLNSRSWSWRYYATITSSVIPFSSWLQPFPASGSFLMSQLFESGGQSTGASVPASGFPMNVQNWFCLGLTSWISLSLKDSQESSPTPQFKSINSLTLSFPYSPTLTSIHDYCKKHRFN